MKLGGCETVVRLTTSYYCHGLENQWRRRKKGKQNGTSYMCQELWLTQKHIDLQFEVFIHVLCDLHLQFVPSFIYTNR